jgi:pyruvate-formate lyase-activating enzyme
MGKSSGSGPTLVFADSHGQVLDAPGMGAACRTGRRVVPIDPRDLIALPRGSELYFLPARQPLGFAAENGSPEPLGDGTAVAAFLPPGYVALALAAYQRRPQAPLLPLYCYAAVCWHRGQFHVPATRVESDSKHDPDQFCDAQLRQLVSRLRQRYPQNRLLEHLAENCALRYGCANAKNLFYGRWEAPVPLAPACNAMCVGCISAQPDAPIPSPQDRLTFVPTVAEVLEFAVPHLESAPRAMISFGQGCEGEPLLQAELMIEIIRAVRQRSSRGTIHLNTNGSRPDAVARLADAGMDSIRVSLNSVQPEFYTRYYRPRTYGFDHVIESIRVARSHRLFTSINYLSFPGVTDSPAEVAALSGLIDDTGLDMIQWRNLNIDPDAYVETLNLAAGDTAIGMRALLHNIGRRYPDVRHGYVNPPIVGYFERSVGVPPANIVGGTPTLQAECPTTNPPRQSQSGTRRSTMPLG